MDQSETRIENILKNFSKELPNSDRNSLMISWDHWKKEPQAPILQSLWEDLKTLKYDFKKINHPDYPKYEKQIDECGSILESITRDAKDSVFNSEKEIKISKVYVKNITVPKPPKKIKDLKLKNDLNKYAGMLSRLEKMSEKLSSKKNNFDLEIPESKIKDLEIETKKFEEIEPKSNVFDYKVKQVIEKKAADPLGDKKKDLNKGLLEDSRDSEPKDTGKPLKAQPQPEKPAKPEPPPKPPKVTSKKRIYYIGFKNNKITLYSGDNSGVNLSEVYNVPLGFSKVNETQIHTLLETLLEGVGALDKDEKQDEKLRKTANLVKNILSKENFVRIIFNLKTIETSEDPENPAEEFDFKIENIPHPEEFKFSPVKHQI